MEIGTDLATHSYMFAIPAYEGKLQVETALSCLSLAGKLTKGNVSHCFNVIRGSALIDAARNEIVNRFLTETECDTLVCIDADIEFSWEAMERLLVFSDKYPIVAGCYCSRQDNPPKFVCNIIEHKLNEHGLLPVRGLGFGFVATQRQVFEKLKEITPVYFDEINKKETYAFFRTGQIDEVNKNYIGEDVWFFKQAVKAGFTPYVDPGIELVHHGYKAYNFQFKDTVKQVLT